MADKDPSEPPPARRVDPRSRACPICRQPTDRKFQPFCSARCADVDLNRWLSGVYAVPSKEPEPAAGDGEDD